MILTGKIREGIIKKRNNLLVISKHILFIYRIGRISNQNFAFQTYSKLFVPTIVFYAFFFF